MFRALEMALRNTRGIKMTIVVDICEMSSRALPLKDLRDLFDRYLILMV
jgi:hypothetical protein